MPEPTFLDLLDDYSEDQFAGGVDEEARDALEVSDGLAGHSGVGWHERKVGLGLG